MIILAFFAGHWYLSLFCQTFFLHRYAAHKMFTMNPFWERFFFTLTYLAQGSSFLSPRAYAILHRLHHAFSDTAKDPHSPHFSGNAFSMMWKTRVIYNDLVNNRVDTEPRFLGNIPSWDVMEWWADTKVSRYGWGVLYVLFYIAFATQWWMFLLLPIHFLMGPVHGAIVNWGGHKYGYQNFDNHDKSRNTMFFDFLTGGELFQNNHHKLPNRINFGVKWWEIDPVYPVIWTLNKAGIIKVKQARKEMKEEVLQAA
jgi:stearoyl-CoA desaturase (delta-9 desaturase)